MDYYGHEMLKKDALASGGRNLFRENWKGKGHYDFASYVSFSFGSKLVANYMNQVQANESASEADRLSEKEVVAQIK
jgi:hypothetical protein